MTSSAEYRKALDGDTYWAIPTEFGWFVKSNQGYNSSESGEYFRTKKEAMQEMSRIVKNANLEYKYSC